MPFGAGGGTDNLARIIEPLVSKALGQPLVIENRPGGGSIIGMDAVAKAAPDGYTLVMTDTSIAVNPSLKPLPYDTIKDFEPVSLLATAPVILVAHPKVPAKTLQEFVALAKAAARQVQLRLGRQRRLDASRRRAVEARRRHRRRARALQGHGTGDERPDRRACRRDVLRHLLGAAAHGCRDACAALAVTGEARNAATPDVPTFAEAGLPGVTASTYWGVLAPKGTPKEIVERVSAEFAKAMRDPDIVARIAQLGYLPIAGGPADYAANIKSEIEKWGQVVKAANIKAD